jgi:glycolate oxidase iron-sulfur subunit
MLENRAEGTLAEQVRPTATIAPGAVRDVVEYELLFDCVHCGLCLESCPTYVITRAEMDSPRGRIYLMKGLAEGQVELDHDAVRHLDLCLECRGCETACPSGVRYGRLIEHARSYITRNWHRGRVERLRDLIIRSIFPYPSRLRAAIAPLRLADRIGARGLLRSLCPPSLRSWIDLVPQSSQKQMTPVPDASLSRSATIDQDSDNRAGGAPKVVVHHGCVAQVLSTPTNMNSEAVLACAGYRVVQLEKTVCCGALDIHHGNLERARGFARITVAALAASGADSIVSAASGCSAVIAQYGELLKNDSAMAVKAREISARVTDLSSLLLDDQHTTFAAGGPNQSPKGGTLSATVTYHDSCHLVHGLGVREQPRELLRSIPGVRLIELAESDLCCGSAGSYNLTERAMAHELVRRKVDNIVATGAQYVVLSNPGCEFQIAAELRRRGSSVRVMHLADFLSLATAASASEETA